MIFYPSFLHKHSSKSPIPCFLSRARKHGSSRSIMKLLNFCFFIVFSRKSFYKGKDKETSIFKHSLIYDNNG